MSFQFRHAERTGIVGNRSDGANGRIRIRGHAQAFEPARADLRIAIEQHDIRAPRPFDAEVAARGVTEVAFVAPDQDIRTTGIRTQDFADGRIGACVVDQDLAPRGWRMPQQRCDATLYTLRRIINWYDDGGGWRGAHRPWRGQRQIGEWPQCARIALPRIDANLRRRAQAHAPRRCRIGFADVTQRKFQVIAAVRRKCEFAGEGACRDRLKERAIQMQLARRLRAQAQAAPVPSEPRHRIHCAASATAGAAA